MNTFFKKYRHFLFHALFIGFLIGLDQVGKLLALRFLNTPGEGSFLGLALHPPVQNYNLIFGFNFGMDILFTASSLTALFCLFLFYYILSLRFIPKSFHLLQKGISAVFAGFTGNFISKLNTGYNIDFIKLSWFENMPIYFNLADIIQTLGWALIISQIALHKKIFWRKDERRNTLRFIARDQQLQFVSYCFLAFFSLCLCFLFMNYQFLGLLDFASASNINQINSSFLRYSFCLLFLLCGFITIFFIYLSNKIYGPLHAFEQHIKDLLQGKTTKDLQLRKGDQLTHLEELAKEIKAGLQTKPISDKSTQQEKK